VTEAAGILLSYDSKKMSALVGTNRFVKDRSRKSRSVQECSWTELAPGTISTYITMCITNSSRDFYSTERQARLCWQWQGKSVKYKHNVLYHSLHQETAVLLLCLAQLVKHPFVIALWDALFVHKWGVSVIETPPTLPYLETTGSVTANILKPKSHGSHGQLFNMWHFLNGDENK